MINVLRPTRRLLIGGFVTLCAVLALQANHAWQASSSQTVSQLAVSTDAPPALFAVNHWLLLLAVFVALCVDLLLSWRFPYIRVERRLSHSLPLDQWTQVTITLTSPWLRPIRVEVMDFVPNDCDYVQLPKQLNLYPRQSQQFSYGLCPRRRGPLTMERFAIRATSIFGLWQITRRLEVTSEARVYPDFAMVEGYQLLAVDNQTSQLGIKRKPRRGQGQDFHQLREYRLGDSMRQIDWKATARRQRLISREYQDERDQQVIMMLDSGRRMLTQDGVSTHFDHCLNCLLMLSYVALRQGDGVAMMSFGSAIRYTNPIKGAGHINRVINQFYDLYPDKSAPDYLEAAESLMNRYRKRSLVVLTTNLRDEDTDDFIAACHLIRKHHVVMIANLRESALDKVLHAPLNDFDDALRYVGTLDYLQQRDKVQNRLKTEGLYVIDSLPQELTPQLINGYFSIKRAGIL